METKSIVLSLFILIICFQSCETSAHYSAKRYKSFDEIILNKDFSFVQFAERQSIKDTFYGKWRKTGDTLLLSFLQPLQINPRNKKNRVKELKTNRKDSLWFYFHFEDSLSVNNPVNLFLNKKINGKPLKSINGLIKIKDSIPINYFYADCIGGSLSYKTNKIDSNLFNIYMYSDTFLSKITRTNIIDKWLIADNKLIPIDSDTNEIISIDGFHLKKVKGSSLKLVDE